MYVLLAFSTSFHRSHERTVYTDAKFENSWPTWSQLEREWETAQKSIGKGEHSISTSTFPRYAKTDVEKLEIRGTIGQSYSPVCQFDIGYTAKFLENEREKERKRTEEKKSKFSFLRKKK